MARKQSSFHQLTLLQHLRFPSPQQDAIVHVTYNRFSLVHIKGHCITLVGVCVCVCVMCKELLLQLES